MFTTNFDQLLEQAIGLNQELCTPIFAEHDVPTFRFDDPRSIQVIKVHGDISDGRSIIFTSRDYESYFQAHPAMRRLIEFVLQTSYVLFLGYSFSDPDLRTMWGQVFSEGGQLSLRSYIVLFDPPDIVTKSLDKRNLQVIALKSGGRNLTQVLEQWIRALATGVKAAEIAQVLSYKSPQEGKAHLPPPTYTTFVARPFFERLVVESVNKHRLTIVDGLPGTGKTSLANKLAREYAAGKHRLQFKHVIWIAAEGGARGEQWLDTVFNHLARATGFPIVAQIPSEEMYRKRGEIRKILGESATLLIIDDYHEVRGNDLSLWLQGLANEPIGDTRVIIMMRPGEDTSSIPAERLKLDGLADDEALELVREQARALKVEAYLTRESHATILELIHRVNGNPQALEQAMGLIAAKGRNVRQVIESLQAGTGSDINGIIHLLSEGSFAAVSTTARRILISATFFPEAATIPHDALQAVADVADLRAYETAVEELVQVRLLEMSPVEKRYTLHPTTRSFASKKLTPERGPDSRYRRRLAEFTLQFLRKVIERNQPSVPYWNALVTESMDVIDREWPIVSEILHSLLEQNSEDIVPFTMLLVHYLDSRFLNKERIDCVSASINITQGRRAFTEQLALLKMDALGWTYIEEGNLDQARAEVEAGASLASGLPDQQARDLEALAQAWSGRITIERAHEARDNCSATLLFNEAELCIKRALASSANAPWILARVLMAAGDVDFKQNRYKSALDHYEAAVTEENKYGGEARNYQLAPRIGFARLELYVDAKRQGLNVAEYQLNEAKLKFQPLAEQKHITIGKIYGDLGLALVELTGQEASRAAEKVSTIRMDVERQSPSYVLRKMIDKLVTDLKEVQL
ncbi:MAG: SIR2 family protein [Acidobacteriota bacterium]|nr:SIR2 family protein [Acidobacteriota bacterium]